MTTVYQFGGFDIANYGDLLFPLLAEKRLSPLGIKIVAVSPIGSEPVWENCLPSVGIDKIVNVSGKPSAVLIGGGNILTLSPTKLPAYNQGSVPILAYPDIWIGASCFANEKVPVCWNAPGVPGPFSEDQRGYVRDCIERSSYVSVRDEQSRNFLREACPDAKISVVPDSAWEIDGLWDKSELAESYEKAFLSRGDKRSARSIAVHLNSRYLGSATDEAIASSLDEVARKLDSRIVLMALGPCHGDDALARHIGEYMKSLPLIIDKPNSLKEIAGCIAHAQAYVGSSMHGLITSSAFGVPGICVTDGKKTKFQGLKTLFHCEDMWSQSWESISGILLSMDMDRKKSQLQELRKRMQKNIDEHWQSIISLIENQTHNLEDSSGKASDSCCRIIKSFLTYRAEFAAMEAIKHIRRRDQQNTNSGKIASMLAEKDRVIDCCRKELHNIYTSWSWPCTAPLRKIGALLRQVSALASGPSLYRTIKRVYLLVPSFLCERRFIENMKYHYKKQKATNDTGK